MNRFNHDYIFRSNMEIVCKELGQTLFISNEKNGKLLFLSVFNKRSAKTSKQEGGGWLICLGAKRPIQITL